MSSTTTTPANATTASTIKQLDHTNWKACWKPRTRARAVNRGIEYIERISLDVGNFAHFGDQVIQLYYDIARVSGWNEEGLRRRCLKYLEHNAERWHYEARDKPWCADVTNPTPAEIIEVIGGMYALERASLSSPFNKEEVSTFIVAAAAAAAADGGGPNAAPTPAPTPAQSKQQYNSTVLIGWDPLTEPPPNNHSELCLDCGQRSDRNRKMCQYCGKQLNIVSKYRIFSNSLINTFYADNALMPFGGHDYYSILKHLPTLRPYQMYGVTDISWMDFWQGTRTRIVLDIDAPFCLFSIFDFRFFVGNISFSEFVCFLLWSFPSLFLFLPSQNVTWSLI